MRRDGLPGLLGAARVGLPGRVLELPLKVPRDALHEPDPARRRPPSRRDEPVESPLEARLRRAWDWLIERLRGRP
jgi:hypothetical protein